MSRRITRSWLLFGGVALVLSGVLVSCERATEPEAPAAQALEGGPLAGQAVITGVPPIAIPDFYATTEDVSLVVSAPGLIANDIDPDGGSFLATSFTAPSNGTVTSIVTSGAFTYVPDAGFVGTDEFTYVIRDDDSNFSESATVTIAVLANPNRPPIIMKDAYATLMDVTLSVPAPGLIGNDIDPDGDPFLATSFTAPSNGTLTSIVTSGAFTYVPDPGFVGVDEFTYTIRDDNNEFSLPDTVTIEVLTPGGTIPVAMPDVYATTEDVSLVVSAPGLIANDIDPDGGSFLATSFTAPSNGTLTSIVTSGAFTYVPDAGFVGTDEFTYVIRDNDSNFSESATVTIAVLANPNRPPIIMQDAYATLKDVTLSVPAPGLIGNDIDPDGDPFLATSFTAPSSGTLTSIVTSGAFTYVPDPGFVGVDEFTYTIRDDNNEFSLPDTVTIYVVAEDVTPPEIVLFPEPHTMWPPKRKYRTFSVAELVSAVNDDGDPSLTPGDVTITRVTCDEPAEVAPGGALALADILIAPQCKSVDLLAERAGGGNGRVYVIELAVADANGNVGTASVHVQVPLAKPHGAQEDAVAQTVNSPCGATAISSWNEIGDRREEKK